MTLAGGWVVLDTVASTQTVAAELMAQGTSVGVVFAHDQTRGRGRFGRDWHSLPGESVTMSLVFPPNERPWLLGMAVALLAAETFDCKVQWPNDVVLGGKKVGGVLTELFSDHNGILSPVVGVGLNLNQSVVPKGLEGKATSLRLANGGHLDPLEAAQSLVAAIEEAPAPHSWADLAEGWCRRDTTEGKAFLTPANEWVTAVGIGAEGELIAEHSGETVRVFAADAWFGL